MKKAHRILGLLCLMTLPLLVLPRSVVAETADNYQILVAYFSATGNTKKVAETIAELTGGDLFEIVPATPYTASDLNYRDESCRANVEQSDSTARPLMAETITDMTQYRYILIGHPIWWGEEPRILDSFMESYDWSGKTVVNFCTSGSSGIGTATAHLQALSTDAHWLEGHRFEANCSADTAQAWLDTLDIGF